MKKLICLVALASITFGSVYAHSATSAAQQTQTDTTKVKKKKGSGMKKKNRMKKDSTMKDTSRTMTPQK
jgi:hypothetical protein